MTFLKSLPGGSPLVVVFNYVTAYQMMRRSARVRQGQRALIHGAADGIGTALLQIGRLVDLEMYGTAAANNHELVSGLGATPIDYRHADFVREVLRLTGDGVDVVFDGIGGARHLWRSFEALRSGGKVVAYGMTSTLRKGRLAGGQRHRLRNMAAIGGSIAASYLIPSDKKMTTYSIQTLKRFRPAWYREFFLGLFAGAIWLTCLYNSTGGSILMVAAWHTTCNLVNQAATVASVQILSAMSVMVMVLAVAVVISFGPRTLSPRDKQEAPPFGTPRVR